MANTVKKDVQKILKKAEEQGFRIIEGKEYYRVYAPDDERGDKPCTIGHTPSSQRTLRNFVACLKRKGYKQ